MLQYVHEVRRDGFVKQEGLRPGLADIDAAFFADGGLLIGLLRVDLLLQLCLQDGRADRESVRDGLLEALCEHGPQGLHRGLLHRRGCADTELQHGLVGHAAVRAEGKHAERVAGLLVPAVLHLTVLGDGTHGLLHDAVRAQLRRLDTGASGQKVQKCFAFKRGCARIVVQKALCCVAAIDAEQIPAAPDEADIRDRAAQHILDRGLQRRAELGRGAEQRVERERADDGIALSIHLAGLLHARQHPFLRHPVQRQQDAVLCVPGVLRAAQVAAVEQIGDIPGHELGRAARDGVRVAFGAVGVVDDLNADGRAGGVIALDQAAQQLLVRIKVDEAEGQGLLCSLRLRLCRAGRCLRLRQFDLRLGLLLTGGEQKDGQEQQEV